MVQNDGGVAMNYLMNARYAKKKGTCQQKPGSNEHLAKYNYGSKTSILSRMMIENQDDDRELFN